MNMKIKRFDPHTADERDYAALNAFEDSLRAESWPGEPSIALEQTVSELLHIPPFVGVHLWTASRGECCEMAATAKVLVKRGRDNQHMAFFQIAVLPELRRQGIGRRMLGKVAEAAHRERRNLLVTSTDAAVPAGALFLRRLGAREGQVTQISQLDLRSLDRRLLRAWQEAAPSAAFDLEVWEGPYPAGALPEVAGMKRAMNLAPRDELELENSVWTEELLRQFDESLIERCIERWTIVARARQTGAIAGYTEVFGDPNRVTILQQGDTAVLPEFQRRGLGRWLKAAMLKKVLRDRPEVERIQTATACSNAAWMRVNAALGFRPIRTWTIWQIELDQVLRYLATAAS